MKLFRLLQFLLVFVIVMSAAGCQASSASPQPTLVETATSDSNAYPYQGDTGTFVYASPDETQTTENTMVYSTPVPPVDAPQPEAGKASLSGIIFSHTIGRVLPKTNLYLTHGFGPEDKDFPPALIGPLESKGDIQATTDENGIFTLNSVLPGNYYLVVEAPYNWSVMQVSDLDSKPRLLKLMADQSYALGVVFVSWP